MSTDDEYSSPAVPTEGGKRKRLNSSESLKKRKKRVRNSVDARMKPHVACSHTGEHWCKASNLTPKDINVALTFWNNKFIEPFVFCDYYEGDIVLQASSHACTKMKVPSPKTHFS